MANGINFGKLDMFDFSFLKPKQEQRPAEPDLVRSELEGTIASGGMSQFLEQMLLTGTKKIGKQARGAREDIRELGAASGFRGAGANILTDVFESEAGAVAELETGVGGIAQQRESEALGRLIGVEQFEQTSAEQKRQFEKMFGLKEKELDAMIDAQGGDLMSVISNFLGAGTGIVAGGALGGLASGVGNIFEGFFGKKP